MKIDVQFQTLDHDLNHRMPAFWRHATTRLDSKSEKVLDLHFHSYVDSKVCQSRNKISYLRILLNEPLLEHFLRKGSSTLAIAAYNNIEAQAGEICASVPQYADCEGAARKRLPLTKTAKPSPHAEAHHEHTHDHQLDCYTLIFSLYVAGRSNTAPRGKVWVIKQLRYIASHFNLRNAEVVAQILEQDTEPRNPWDVFAMLGSYVFV